MRRFIAILLLCVLASPAWAQYPGTPGPGQILGNYTTGAQPASPVNWLAAGTSCPSWLTPYQIFANTNSAPSSIPLTIWDGSACVTIGTLNASTHTFSNSGTVNGVSYPANPSVNRVPVVTSTNQITYEIVPLAAGGTNAALTGSNGAILYLTATSFASLAYPSVNGECLLSGQPPTWGTCNSSSPGVASIGNVSADSTLTITGTGSGPWTGNVTAKCTVATTSQVGCGKPDGSSIVVNAGVWTAILGVTTINETNSTTVTTGQSGSAFNNAGAIGSVILSLPACTSNLEYEGFVATGHNLEFLANGTDMISVGASISAAGGNIVSSLYGSKVRLLCDTTGIWSSLNSGSWTVN